MLLWLLINKDSIIKVESRNERYSIKIPTWKGKNMNEESLTKWQFGKKMGKINEETFQRYSQ